LRTLHELKKFVALPTNRRAISIEAVITLGVARLLVLTVPIRWIARRLERQATLPHAQPGEAGDIVREVGWAVRAAAPKTPGRVPAWRRLSPASGCSLGVASTQRSV
jgi:hypothetical protein